MEKIILALSPNNKKVQVSQFFVEAESTKDGIDILNKEYPGEFRVVGVSAYLANGEEFIDRSFK